jgi:hypothetical protein
MQIVLGATGFFKFNLINTIPSNYQFLIPKKTHAETTKDPGFNVSP